MFWALTIFRTIWNSTPSEKAIWLYIQIFELQFIIIFFSQKMTGIWLLIKFVYYLSYDINLTILVLWD